MYWVIIATGPSLTRQDCETLRDIGPTVAVNCGVFYAPWADYCFAADHVWWRFYGPKINPWYKGQKVSRTMMQRDITRYRSPGWGRTGGNSGHMAIQFAVDQGAKQIALLGFDQQKTNGKAHCHVDHPKSTKDGARTNMANANGVMAWPRMMNKTSIELKQRNVEVVNLSRQTALKCFPRLTVEEFMEATCR